MPYGFFITDKGRELIDKAIPSESKVEITTACFGSGGSPEDEFDYSITELKNQFYEKPMNPETDSFKIDDQDPYAMYIQSELPNDVTGTVNEIGYKNPDGDLIIYGVVRERVKEAGTPGGHLVFQYRNWIKLENGDVDKIDINVRSAEYERVTKLVEETKLYFDNKLDETNTQLDSLLDRAEKDFNLDSYIKKEELMELENDEIDSMFETSAPSYPGTYPEDWVEADTNDIDALFN